MRILLTGASGFTGRHFKDHARREGHEVVTLSANLTDAVAVKQAVLTLGAVDAVVHLAAVSFVGHANEAEFYSVNAVGTTQLLSALAALPVSDQPGKVLVASSANVYGNCVQSPISESQPPAPVNHYAASKLAMEFMAMAYLDRLPVIITRPFNYTGPGQTASFLIPKLINHFVHKSPSIDLGNLNVEREFNDVRMVTEAYLRLLLVGTPGEIYNVCSGKTHSLQAVLDLLMQQTSHHIEVRTNKAYVRTNEVRQLCGCPEKLHRSIGTLPHYELRDCLSTMLACHSSDAN